MTWKTWKCQGKYHKIPKVREFCCVKSIFSQFEDPYFENFIGEHAHIPPVNALKLTVKFDVTLEKSWKGQEIASPLESRNPV